MVLGDEKSLKYDELVIDKNKKLSKITSSNENIVSISDGTMKANSLGECEIKVNSKIASMDSAKNDLNERKKLTKEFFECKEEITAIREMRKHIAWYTKNMPNSSEFRNEINKIEDKDALIEKVEEFFTTN